MFVARKHEHTMVRVVEDYTPEKGDTFHVACTATCAVADDST